MIKEITILGVGFGALTAVKELRKQQFDGQIKLIAPKAQLLYYPSLIWVPAGLRTESDLTVDLHGFFKRNNVNFIEGNVTGLNPQTNLIYTDKNEASFEKLIIATGGRFIKKLSGIEHICIPCENFASVQNYSNKFNELKEGTLAFGFAGNPNEPAAMRGGPVFEFLFGIDTLLRKQKRRQNFELLFFNPVAQPGKRLGEKAVSKLLQEMQKRGIKTHLGEKLKGFTAHSILTETTELKSNLTLFMPGMTGSLWAEKSGLPLSAGGFIQGDAQCRVPDFKDIFIVGDAGSFPGPDWIPKQAHLADLQAKTAVKNLLYNTTEKFKVELICIVDSLDGGVLVYRDLKRALNMSNPLFHHAKKFFEWYYLRSYK
jgi:sulfide:quinone oxidoreductase